MKLKGQVIEKEIGKGTKSERVAIVLRTPEADYALRREGGNAFRDNVLEELVGKEIECEGEIAVNNLIMSAWHVIDGRKPK